MKKIALMLAMLVVLGTNAFAGTSCTTTCYGNTCTTNCYNY
jgi:hypothetical protein